MLTPGRKPQFKDQFGKLGEKVENLFEGKTANEKRKAQKDKLQRKIERLKKDKSEEAEKKRIQLRGEITKIDIEAKKAREKFSYREDRDGVRWRRSEPDVGSGVAKAAEAKSEGLSKVRFKKAEEYLENDYTVPSPDYISSPAANMESTVNLTADMLRDVPRAERTKLEFTLNGKLVQELDNEEFIQLSKLDEQVSIWSEYKNGELVYAAQMEDEHPRYYSNTDQLLADVKQKLRVDQNTLTLLDQLDLGRG